MNPIFDKAVLIDLVGLIGNGKLDRSSMTDESWELVKGVNICTATELLSCWIEYQKDDVDIWTCLIENLIKYLHLKYVRLLTKNRLTYANNQDCLIN